METALTSLETICRLCLEDSSTNLHHVFDEGLSNKIIILSGLDLQNNDALPKHICRDCRWIVEKSYHLRMVAKQSDTRLRKHIRLISQNKPSNLLNKTYQDDDTQEYEELYQESYKYFEEAKNEVNKLKLEFEAAKEQIVNEEVEKARQMFVTETRSSSKKNNHTSQNVPESPRLLNKCPSPQKFPSTATIRRKNQRIKPAKNPDNEEAVVVLGDYEIQIEVDEEFEKINSNTEIEFISEVEYIDENTELQDFNKKSDEQLKIAESSNKNKKKSPRGKRPSETNKQTKAKASKKLAETVPVKTDSPMEPAEDNYFKTIDDVDDEDLDENGEKKIFQCAFEDCTKKFARRQACKTHYYNHLVSRALPKGYKCTYCQKTFKVGSALERHERIHTGQKPFKCNVDGCTKAFSQKEMLKRHKVIHLSIEDAPYLCNICGKKFRQKEPLRQHINKVHSEDAEQSHQFVCTICQKQFAHSSGLSRHLLIHSGRRFNCDICDKVFNDQSALKRHRGIHNK